jgi:hypothetical protein
MAYPVPTSHRVYKTNSSSELLARRKEAIEKATNAIAIPVVSASEFTARVRKSSAVIQPMLPARPEGISASTYTALAESNPVRSTNAYQRLPQYSSVCCGNFSGGQFFTGPTRVQQNFCTQTNPPANPSVVPYERSDIRKNDNKVVIAASSRTCAPCPIQNLA